MVSRATSVREKRKRPGKRSGWYAAIPGVLVIMFVFSHAAHAITLTVHVDKTEVVLGGAVALEVTSVTPGDARPLNALTLDALAADFEVLDVSRGTRSLGGKTTQTLTALLYPRRAGRAHIPALRVPNAYSAPIDIMVRESGPDRGRVVFRTGIEPNPPFVRGSAVLYLDIFDGNDLTWSAPEPLHSASVHLRALAESRRNETIDGERYPVWRYSWAATVLRDGEIEIALESLRARKFGQRLRYSVPKFKFTAQSVPAYLPVYVPIGAPEIHVEPSPVEWFVGRPVNWRFTVTGAGLSANGLKQLFAATLGAGQGVQWYAPVVELVEEARPRTPQQTFRVTIPVQALEHGEVELPSLALPYFDAQRGRLETLMVPGSRFAAIDPLYQTGLRIVAVIIVLLLVAGSARYGLSWGRQLRRRREMFARIQRAQNASDIKSAVLECAVARDARPCPTLKLWSRRGGMSVELRQWITQLERACYAARAADVAALKNSARRVLRAIPES